MQQLRLDVAREVVTAYRRRGKGLDQPFVDITRRGAHLEVHPDTLQVFQLTPSEYVSSNLPKCIDGVPAQDARSNT